VQDHNHRAEHWIVVQDTAEVTRGADIFLQSENQSTYIPIGTVHRLHNPGQLEVGNNQSEVRRLPGRRRHRTIENSYGREQLNAKN